MRVAIEYAGRWYGTATVPWLQNHHANIVRSSPLCTFDVFVALIRDQLCVKSLIEAERVKDLLSSVFASQNVDQILVQYVDTAHNASRLSMVMRDMVVARSHASSWKTANVLAWYRQSGTLPCANTCDERVCVRTTWCSDCELTRCCNHPRICTPSRTLATRTCTLCANRGGTVSKAGFRATPTRHTGANAYGSRVPLGWTTFSTS